MHNDARSSSADDDDPRLSEPAGSPSSEALFAMRVAGAVARQLQDAGREVRFTVDPSLLRGRVEIALCDRNGTELSRLTPSRALEIATGSPVVGGRR